MHRATVVLFQFDVLNLFLRCLVSFVYICKGHGAGTGILKGNTEPDVFLKLPFFTVPACHLM